MDCGPEGYSGEREPSVGGEVADGIDGVGLAMYWGDGPHMS